jgi:putative copper export protein
VQGEPGFEWAEPVEELVEFVFAFLATGAVGFRYTALAHRLGGEGVLGRFHADAARRAAAIGLVAQAIGVGRRLLSLPQVAERQHTTVAGVLTAFPGSLGTWLGILALLGFLLAVARVGIGWPLAAIGVIVAPLSPLFTGQLERIVVPVHMLLGGLWLGTLFVLVVAGLAPLLRHEPTRAERGRTAADMVNAFSPLALVCGILVVLTGLLNAVRHLGTVSDLWSTPYGIALVVKLVLVACVFGLGAWNWRRQRPRLGSEDAAVSIRRSARSELTAAALVLVATAVMVSFPAPGEEHEAPPPPPAASAPTAAAPGR